MGKFIVLSGQFETENLTDAIITSQKLPEFDNTLVLVYDLESHSIRYKNLYEENKF